MIDAVILFILEEAEKEGANYEGTGVPDRDIIADAVDEIEEKVNFICRRYGSIPAAVEAMENAL